MDISQIVFHLSGIPIPEVKYFDQTGSTNDDAIAWILAGAPDGSLVIANRQTEGRGRLGRRWITQPGSALAFSLILRPTPAEQVVSGLFTALGALAISRALEIELGLQPEIKWPNDILLNRKKVAGILVESSWIGDTLQGLVLGIGLNISPEAVPPPDQLIYPATSVEEAAGRPVSRLELLRAISGQIFEWRAKIGDPVFRSAWEDRLAFKGEWVSIHEAADPEAAPVNGEVIGLDPSGSLVLRLASGDLVSVVAGDVHLRSRR